MEMATSKAWRAVLPRLREDQLASLEIWARNNCAIHATMQDDRGRTILLGLDSKPRTAASFARTLRSVYHNRAINTSSLCGSWLRLLTVREVLLAAYGALGSGAAPDSETRAARTTAEKEEDDGTRLVRLY